MSATEVAATEPAVTRDEQQEPERLVYNPEQILQQLSELENPTFSCSELRKGLEAQKEALMTIRTLREQEVTMDQIDKVILLFLSNIYHLVGADPVHRCTDPPVCRGCCATWDGPHPALLSSPPNAPSTCVPTHYIAPLSNSWLPSASAPSLIGPLTPS